MKTKRGKWLGLIVSFKKESIATVSNYIREKINEEVVCEEEEWKLNMNIENKRQKQEGIS